MVKILPIDVASREYINANKDDSMFRLDIDPSIVKKLYPASEEINLPVIKDNKATELLTTEVDEINLFNRLDAIANQWWMYLSRQRDCDDMNIGELEDLIRLVKVLRSMNNDPYKLRRLYDITETIKYYEKIGEDVMMIMEVYQMTKEIHNAIDLTKIPEPNYSQPTLEL